MTFNECALGHEPAVRLGAFFGMFALMAIWGRWRCSRSLLSCPS